MADKQTVAAVKITLFLFGLSFLTTYMVYVKLSSRISDLENKNK